MRQGHDSLESDATLYGQHHGTALVGSLLLHSAQARHGGVGAATEAMAGWDVRPSSVQALLQQVRSCQYSCRRLLCLTTSGVPHGDQRWLHGTCNRSRHIIVWNQSSSRPQLTDEPVTSVSYLHFHLQFWAGCASDRVGLGHAARARQRRRWLDAGAVRGRRSNAAPGPAQCADRAPGSVCSAVACKAIPLLLLSMA